MLSYSTVLLFFPAPINIISSPYYFRSKLIYIIVPFFLLYSTNYFFAAKTIMMIVGHSLILVTGAIFVYDWLRFRKQKKQLKNTPKTIKLCLTGGPCGGKSQGIQCIYSTFKQVSAPFFIVPEAATLIGSSGLALDFPNFSAQQIQNFQIYLMRLQYNLQGILEDVAKILQKLGKCPVLLCDRGLLDGKAYAGKQNWDRMLKQLNVQFLLTKITQQEINARYKAVIHMETAARGARQSYFYVPPKTQDTISNDDDSQGKVNKTRKQPPEVAISLDEKVQACYKDHPYRFVIRNYFFVKNFQMKKVLLIAQVNQILEWILKSVNIEHYYQQFKEKDGSQDAKVAYIQRKRKYQKFINRAKPKEELKEE